jgi:hypothetical protein
MTRATSLNKSFTRRADCHLRSAQVGSSTDEVYLRKHEVCVRLTYTLYDTLSSPQCNRVVVCYGKLPKIAHPRKPGVDPAEGDAKVTGLLKVNVSLDKVDLLHLLWIRVQPHCQIPRVAAQLMIESSNKTLFHELEEVCSTVEIECPSRANAEPVRDTFVSADVAQVS